MAKRPTKSDREKRAARGIRRVRRVSVEIAAERRARGSRRSARPWTTERSRAAGSREAPDSARALRAPARQRRGRRRAARRRHKGSRVSCRRSRRNRRARTRSRARARPRRGDPAAVDAIRGPAGHQSQQEQRHELHQPDDPEPQRGFLQAHRVAGDIVDLPADDDDHRHLRDRRREAGEPEIAECRNSKRFGEEAHPARLAQHSQGGNRSLGVFRRGRSA